MLRGFNRHIHKWFVASTVQEEVDAEIDKDIEREREREGERQEMYLGWDMHLLSTINIVYTDSSFQIENKRILCNICLVLI